MIFKYQDLQTSAEFIGAKTRFAVFGKPISHSLSPLMQNAALGETTKFKSSKYYAFEIDAEILTSLLGDFHKKNFLGINLTIPHKEVVIPALKEIDISAKRAKACNTLLRIDGGWRGYNTDGFGLEYAIKNFLKREIKGAEIILLGAGGAARGAAFHLLANGCANLKIANRSLERLENLVIDIRADGFACQALSLSPDIEIPENAIVVNCTSIGLKSDDNPVLDFSKFPKNAVFFDMPYRRDAETVSVLEAHKHSIKAQSGLPMLAYQGAKSLSIWTGEDCQKLGKTMLKALGL